LLLRRSLALAGTGVGFFHKHAANHLLLSIGSSSMPLRGGQSDDSTRAFSKVIAAATLIRRWPGFELFRPAVSEGLIARLHHRFEFKLLR
jgi:hypothetical protein